MKALKVDFVQDRFAAIWWTAVSIGLAICLVAWGYRLQQKTDLREQAQEQLAHLQQSQKLSQIDANKPLNTQQKKLQQVASELNLDLNPIFAVVENVNVAGTLLKTMQLDKSSGTLRLEFQLEDPNKASEISEALNAGDESHPWMLEGISTQFLEPSASLNSAGAVFQPRKGRFTAIASWSYRFGRQ
jgi:cbb3-type cytochrome oxidase subunit 3